MPIPRDLDPLEINLMGRWNRAPCDDCPTRDWCSKHLHACAEYCAYVRAEDVRVKIGERPGGNGRPAGIYLPQSQLPAKVRRRPSRYWYNRVWNEPNEWRTNQT